MQARRHERGLGQMVGGAKRTKGCHKGLHEGSISVGASAAGGGGPGPGRKRRARREGSGGEDRMAAVGGVSNSVVFAPALGRLCGRSSSEQPGPSCLVG